MTQSTRIYTSDVLDSLLVGDGLDEVFLSVDHPTHGHFMCMLFGVYTDGRFDVGLEDGDELTLQISECKVFTV